MEASAPPRPRAVALRSPDRLRSCGDAELVRLIRLGHEPAFEEVYDRHHRGILSFCRHMLGSREEAEDAVQHAFIAAYRDLRASNKPIHLKAWLYTIARNRCLSMLRARREQVSIEDVEPATEGLAAEVQRRQDLQDMLRDLHRLPEDQRAALVLSELGALSHEEIAMTLDVRKDKVKALVFQARESLMSSRKARDTDCEEIQKQLSVLRGGALRRTTLRRHVEDCVACQTYREELQRQRAALAIILPVAPSAGLKAGVLSSAVSAAGAAGGAGLIAGGGSVIGAKLIVGAVLIGAGVGGGLMAIDELRSPPPSAADESQRRDSDLKMIGGRDAYARSDKFGRPVDGEPARSVDRLRVRAQTVALQRDKDRRTARAVPVWGTAIPGDRTGPDPAIVVTLIPDALGFGAGADGDGGGKADRGAPGSRDDDKAKKPKKPKKAKKPKISQGQGAQGKGNAFGRGREPAAGNGNGNGKSKDKAGGNGGAPKAKASPGSGNGGGAAAPGAKSKGRAGAPAGPKPKAKSKPRRSAPPSGGPKQGSRAKAAPAPAAPPPAKSNGNDKVKDKDGGDAGGRQGGPVTDAVDRAKGVVNEAKPRVESGGEQDKGKLRAVFGALLGAV